MKLNGPLDLVHARGLAAVMRDLDARSVQVSSVTVRVSIKGGGTTPVSIDNPVAVAREAEIVFARELESAVRDIIDPKPENEGWSRWAGRIVATATKNAGVATGNWIADKTPQRLREGVAATGVLVKQGALAAGSVIGAGVEAAASFASRFDAGRKLQRRVNNAEVVATKVIVDVVDRDGGAVCYAPWVIDPLATLRNEKTSAYVNGAMTTLGWGPVGPIAQGAIAAYFGVWGAISSDEAEGRARTNMGIEQALQAVASVVPFASFYTLPVAVAKDIADAKLVSDGIRNGDPFVTFYPTSLTEKQSTAA